MYMYTCFTSTSTVGETTYDDEVYIVIHRPLLKSMKSLFIVTAVMSAIQRSKDAAAPFSKFKKVSRFYSFDDVIVVTGTQLLGMKSCHVVVH